jgi:LPXTG-motif cell wall-anchored protein
MDQTQQLLALVGAAVVGLLAILFIARRQRLEREAGERESPFAASTEGQKLCPKCGMGNLWTDFRCISCGATLRGG